MITRAELTPLLVGLSEMFDKEVSKANAEMYFHLLKEFEYVEVHDAIWNILKKRTFSKMPLPGEIANEIETDIDLRALMAWRSANAALKKIDKYKTVIFKDPVIPYVIESYGGWIYFCEQHREVSPMDVSFSQKEFDRRYRVFAQSFSPNSPIPRMIGENEVKNRARAAIDSSGRGFIDGIPVRLQVDGSLCLDRLLEAPQKDAVDKK